TYNATETIYPKQKTLVDLFVAHAQKAADTIAVVFEDNALTYGELDTKSNQLAQYLLETYHPQPNDTIGIVLERSEWLIISILGILKTGAAYVPMAVEFPESRIEYIRENAGCKAVIDQKELLVFQEKAANFSNTLPTQVINSDNVAYVIYTSGTTGNPKGVMIAHKNAVNFMSYFNAEKQRISLTCKPIFDVSVMEIFTAITSGSTLYIPKEEITFDPEAYAKFLHEKQITRSYLHPMHVHRIAKALQVFPEIFLEKIILGVEPIKPEMVAWYLSKNICVINAYGPSETTICATACEVNTFENITAPNIPVGKPIANCQVYIVDSQYNTLQPDGILGEVCISGDGVGKGYINQPELTAEKFIPHPFIEGEIIYKTGDLARKLPDGNLEFVGRSDRQVKIRGHRIELGEIEAALTSIHQINIAYIDVQLHQNEKYLVAYYVSAQKLQTNSIRKHLQSKLPDYMLPSFYKELSQLPLTVNGKIDRKQLPTINFENSVQSTYVMPTTLMQKELVSIWKHVLGVSQLGITNNFFELGGHSMKAMQLVNQINATFESNLRIRDVFLYPTIAQLSTHISKDQKHQIQPAAIQPNYAVSNIQQQIWIESQIAEGSKAYHMPFVIELAGIYKADILHKAVDEMMARHEILRTVFRKDDTEIVRQWILSAEETIKRYNVFDYTQQENPKALVNTYVSAQNEALFNLAEGPLFEYALFQLPENKSVFYLKLHHIIADGWSVQLLLQELFDRYEQLENNSENTLAPLAFQFKDYAEWEKASVTAAAFNEHETFWKKTLSGTLPVLDLPSTKVRPKFKTYKGASFETSLSKETAQQLRTFSIANEGSLFMTLLTAWKVLLHKYTNADDIIIGSPVATRDGEILEQQIGPYINTIALRTKVTATENFETLYEAVKNNALAAFTYKEYPLDVVLEQMDSKRDRSRSPIFDILFTSQNVQSSVVNAVIPPADALVFRDNVPSKFDLNLSFYESEDTIVLGLNFNTDVYAQETIRQLFNHYKTLIPTLLQHSKTAIADISVLSASEQEQYIQALQTKEVTIDSNDSIVASFQKIVRNTPENIAIQTPNTKLSYRELDVLSNQFSNYIQEQYTISSETGIVVQVDQDEWFFVAMLSILKMGCFFIPVDTNFPEKRVKYIIEDSQSALCLDTEFIKKFSTQKEAYSKEFAVAEIVSNTTCYSIYTSGTTGKPKGV
ncbi:MAG: amino acid adenylation domain-containing protein, partial [Bacteroidota bacterium]